MKSWMRPLGLLAALALLACNPDKDDDGFKADEDCDDESAEIYPGADELCDEIDNDCDGEVDESEALDATYWFTDADGDGYGDPDDSTRACVQPEGTTTEADALDCDDGEATTYPAADEYCDGVDNDCDDEVDEADALDASTWYADSDDDGYGDELVTMVACDQPSGYESLPGDCDDDEAAVNPDADEHCDDIDNDCDGTIDEADALDASTWYADTDADGWGDPASMMASCDQPTGYVSDNTDCDDTNEYVLTCCTEGMDGDFDVTSDSELSSGVYWFDNFTVSAGATLTLTGEAPVIVYANYVDIAGSIDLSGYDGLDTGSSSLPDGGDAGPGGGGGGGGGDCGNGGGEGGEPGGETPGDGNTDGGYGGLPWSLSYYDYDSAQGGGYGPGGGGGGGGSADEGGYGDRYGDDGGDDGYGGSAFGDETLELYFTGGGGGAGGGANGGGGGGGGGALAIFASTLDLSGSIDATGGDGGVKTGGSCTSGGGGGGAGGMVWLQADSISFTGSIDVSGGAGGPSDTETDQYGGDGSDGRVRISGADLSLSGTVSPTWYEDTTYPECDAYETDDSIYDIQGGLVAENTWVNARELEVTGVAYNGFFAQEPDGDEYSGIWVYASGVILYLEQGDVVNVEGEYYEYSTLSELDVSEGFVTFVESDRSAATPEVVTVSTLTNDATAEAWEGVLITIESVTVDDEDLGYGEFSVDGVVVDDQLYDWSEDFSLAVGDSFTSITGVLTYTFGAYKLEPRSVDDYAGYTPVK